MIKSKIIAFVAAAVLLSASTVSAAFMFNTNLSFGMRNDDVRELQLRLNQEVGTTLPGTTYFGPQTREAAKQYQTMKSISPVLGYVGPLTRAALNGSTAPTTGTLPAGCTSTSGWSPTTGVACNSTSGSTLPFGCTSTTGWSPSTGVKCDSTSGSTPQTGPVTAMFSGTPASSTLVAGQATATLANFTFSGTGTVTNVTLQRTGVSADSTLSNVYLFDGANRLTDAATVTTNGMITFNSGAGLFMVNGSKTISVKSDIAASTSGQTAGVNLVSFMTTAGTTTANAMGNLHSIATATLATISAGTVTPSGATINPGAAVTVWQSTLNISQRDVMMKRLAVRQIGSAPANAFANFKLYVNGVQVATATGLDAMGYVTFDMSNTPVTLASGSRIVRVDADVVSGASRTVHFSVRQAADVDFVDSSYGVNITPTSTPWSASTASTIGGTTGGSMTIEKDTSSPTQPVTLGGNDVKLGTFKATAYGEAIKIETLRATYASNDANVSSLRNGRIMINGVQYGSSATLLEDSNGVGYTSYTINYTVMPGTPVLIDVYADMNDNDGTDNLSGGDTFAAALVTGSSNASKQDSLGYINVPAASVSANTITASSATVTLAKDPTYANQTVAVPQTSGYKIGVWNLTGSSVEDVLLSTLSFDVDAVSGATFTEADLTNLTVVVKNGSGATVASPSPLGTVAAADNNFSINYTLAKNTSASVELWATIGSTITATHSLKTDLTVTGTAMVSGTAVSNADVDGQTIVASTGSITATQNATSASARIVSDNQTIDIADFKFEALYAGYNVTDLTFTIANATNVANVMLYDGATMVASKAGSTTVTFNGLNWNIPANTSKILTVKLQLGTTGIGAGTSGASLVTTLTDFTATSTATGVSAAGTESDPASNATYVYAATPTVTLVSLPTSTLSTGTVTASKFTVASNGGTIAWKKIIFTVTRAMGGTDTLASPTLWDANTGVQIAGTPAFTGSVEADGGTAGTITFVADDEQQISGSKTYVLKMTTAGTFTSGDNLNVSIAQPSTFAAPAAYATVAATTSSFTWSDISAASHSATTTDWSNGYLVQSLPTDSQTLRVN